MPVCSQAGFPVVVSSVNTDPANPAMRVARGCRGPKIMVLFFFTQQKPKFYITGRSFWGLKML